MKKLFILAALLLACSSAKACDSSIASEIEKDQATLSDVKLKIGFYEICNIRSLTNEQLEDWHNLLTQESNLEHIIFALQMEDSMCKMMMFY